MKKEDVWTAIAVGVGIIIGIGYAITSNSDDSPCKNNGRCSHHGEIDTFFDNNILCNDGEYSPFK